jgi:flavin reductase (DIM6/NTAB) family NADH-FMN oxidoreductase RutF
MRSKISAISHFLGDETEFGQKLRKGFRASAVSVSLLTTKDSAGGYQGTAVTATAPVSMSLPSLMVALNHTAATHSAVQASSLYCLNHIAGTDLDLLDRFCRSGTRAGQFSDEGWCCGLHDLPYLETATSSFFCRVIGSHDYGDHTVFVGRIEGVRLSDPTNEGDFDPVIWVNGAARRLTERQYP